MIDDDDEDDNGDWWLACGVLIQRGWPQDQDDQDDDGDGLWWWRLMMTNDFANGDVESTECFAIQYDDNDDDNRQQSQKSLNTNL